jgi:hypothetical protein
MSLCLLSASRNDNWCLVHLEVQQKSRMKLFVLLFVQTLEQFSILINTHHPDLIGLVPS